MIRRSRKHLIQYVKLHEHRKIPFTIDISHKSYVVKSALGTRFFSDNYMSIEGLQLVRRVKKFVVDNNVGKNHPIKTAQELKIRYLCFDRSYIGKKLIAIREIDMDSAYWLTSKRLGIIDSDLFDRGMKLSAEKNDKIARLASIGSLAKKTKRRSFDGLKYSKSSIVKDSIDTRHLWDLVSSKVDKVMQGCMRALGKSFVFYWTDAVFFTESSENINLVQETITKFGYSSKLVNNAWFDFKPDACYIYSVEKGKFMSKKESESLDHAWIRENIDWSAQIELINIKIEKRIKKIEEEQKELKDLPDDNPRKLKLRDIKIKPITIEYINGLNEADFKKFVKKSFRVRNFCYSITNRDMWKGKKMISRK